MSSKDTGVEIPTSTKMPSTVRTPPDAENISEIPVKNDNAKEVRTMKADTKPIFEALELWIKSNNFNIGLSF